MGFGRRWYGACQYASVVRRFVSLMVLALAAAACGGDASTLDPAGPRAARIADLTWLMTAIALVVFLIVLALLAIAVLRRDRPGLWPARRMSDTGIIIAGGIILPALVLPFLWAVTLRDMSALASPPQPTVADIEIVGHQFWYEVSYPDHGLDYRNELFIPVGQPVLLRVTSSDVIHSFWIPRLAGKIDMIPGRTNELWIEASQPGIYRVVCAEFCGLWHAKMEMRIIAESPEAFAARLASGR